MSEKQTPQAEEFEFQAEMSQLLHLITHSLYSHREIFLRELISNASDALGKLHFASLTDQSVLGDDPNLKIRLELDDKAKTLAIIDNGLGMSKKELIENLGTIAKSGTAAFAKKMTGDAKKDLDLIGRFGVGFYSVFMVTDQVTVETRGYKSKKGYRWVSKGTGKFTIEELGDIPRGTKISFKFKKDAAEDFGSKGQLESIVKKYSNFVNFPIELGEEALNQTGALWAKPAKEVTDEEYKEFFGFLSHGGSEALGHLHLAVDVPVQFKSVLFFPKEAPKNMFNPDERDSKINLYVKRVFIQSDAKDLLPAWMRFMVGVVDSEDLSLNVSRESTQHSPVMAKINQYLTKKVLGELKSWTEQKPELYQTFWKGFGNFVKEGIHTDYANKDKLLELYRCASSHDPQGLTSLADYISRLKPQQSEIYYVVGKNQGVIESNPNLEYFKKNGIEVLYFFEEIDEFVLSGVMQYQEKQIVGIDKADLSLGHEEHPEQLSPEESEGLLGLFKTVLGERVSNVTASKRLVDSACTLVSAKDAMGANMERMMKMFDQNFTGGKRVMEVNLAHPLIKNLAGILNAAPEEPILSDIIVQLYEGASLLEGSLEDPSEMVPRIARLMGSAAESRLKALKPA